MWGFAQHLVYPFLCAFCFGSVAIIRKLGLSHAPPMFGYAINVTTAFIAFTAYLMASGQFSTVVCDGKSLRYFVVAGLGENVGVLCVLIALSLGQVSIVTPLNGTAPLFVLVLAFLSQRRRAADRTPCAGDRVHRVGRLSTNRCVSQGEHMTHPESARVVICGAGVIGAAVAYYLSLRGVAATVIERRGVACAASGKSGGFLALDWCDNSPLAPLARKSFHYMRSWRRRWRDYGYRRLTTLAGCECARPHGLPRVPEELAWLDSHGVPYAVLGTPATTAQVHPARFTQALLQAALHACAQLRIGCVDGLEMSQGQVRGVRVDGQLLPADTVVIAMGRSCSAASWLPLPPCGA